MPILGYIAKRGLQAIFVVVAVTLFISFAIRLTGDPAVMMRESANVTPEDLERVREGLGLNRPFLVQYWDFLSGLVTGDLGASFFRGPIAPLVSDALGATVLLALTSLVVSLIISIPLGVYAARHRGSVSDQIIRLLSLTGLSFPNFWLGIVLILIFSVSLRWLPASDFRSPASLIMPAVTIGVILTATNLRIVRTTMLDTLNQQFIMVARAKGLSERSVIYKHALRNSSIALVTYLGLQFGSLMGGLVVVELVFNWPGMGTLAVEAIAQRDYPILQTVISFLAIMIVAVNLLVDLVYMALDPRIRLE
ncbi:ABC transporter permease [Palleronia abyssalis]|uniref:Nickel transport system permease protein NikB n=1 Tax=Palleronia abyssalis TaxID=1501240 RepID=A0A2R8BVA8_9RHOB|nr:ABC transporter permease [Palleronia abyssalis]SPJ24104.1 Nickel transport system permease protein NikB [Palleronia abyssalis]